MSLAQHVTQAEGFDYEPTLADDVGRNQQQIRDGLSWNYEHSEFSDRLPVDNKSGWRRMSFAPAEPPLALETPRPVAAYNVSNAKRLGV